MRHLSIIILSSILRKILSCLCQVSSHNLQIRVPHQLLQRIDIPTRLILLCPRSSHPSAISLRQLTVSGANHTRVLDPTFKASLLKK